MLKVRDEIVIFKSLEGQFSNLQFVARISYDLTTSYSFVIDQFSHFPSKGLSEVGTYQRWARVFLSTRQAF